MNAEQIKLLNELNDLNAILDSDNMTPRAQQVLVNLRAEVFAELAASVQPDSLDRVPAKTLIDALFRRADCLFGDPLCSELLEHADVKMDHGKAVAIRLDR